MSTRLTLTAVRIFTAAFCFLAVPHAFAAPTTPRVAVFSQPGFPFFNTCALISPPKIAHDLRAVGIQTDILNANDLADAGRLNAQTYSAIVLPYGNSYPQAAYANLRRFHQDGGDLIMDGIPFTHAIQAQADGGWKDLGNDSDPELFGPDGIGVGGFHQGQPGTVSVPADNPLGLATLNLNWGDGSDSQTLDTSTLPPSDTVIPLLLADNRPTAAMIVHHQDGFDGAVDVWTANGFHAEDPRLAAVTEQMLARGVIVALAEQKLVETGQVHADFLTLNKTPLPQEPKNIVLPTPPRPYATFQPKMPAPAKHLYVANMQGLSHDQQLLLTSLQGLVNRTQPRIYLVFSKDDAFWLKQMQVQGSTGQPIPVADPMSLLKTFRTVYHGVVVADPKVYESPCIAVDLAGLDNLLIATPALAAQYHLPIKADLRGRFHDDADAMRFARVKLLPRLNPYLSLCLDPVLLGSQVDDIIAARGMAFWVTGPKAQNEPGANEAAERAELIKTFEAMPLDSVVRGFWWHGDGVGLDETPGVALASHFGKVTTVSDYVADFSVLSGVQILSVHQKKQPPAPKFDPTKVYLAFTMSDGDNLCTWRGYFRSYFTDPLHGTFPMGWGMGPSLIDIAPTEVQWYYNHAAPTDEFLGDVSGVGYIYPPDWATSLKDRPAAFASFYGWTQKYLKRLDMHTLRLMGVNPTAIAQAGHDMPEIPFLMPDYGNQGEESYSAYTYTLPTGQPVFRAMMFGSGAENLAGQIRSRVGGVRPAFVNAFVWNWGSKLADLKKMLADLGPNYVAVTPSQLNTLYREAEAQGLVKSGSSGGK